MENPGNYGRSCMLAEDFWLYLKLSGGDPLRHGRDSVIIFVF